jgi:hypothetical protein
VFRDFRVRLEGRIREQQSLYGVDPGTAGIIGVEDFAWLDPANSKPEVESAAPPASIFVPEAAFEELAKFSPEIMIPYHFADAAGEEVRGPGSEESGLNPWRTAEWPAEPAAWWLPEGRWRPANPTNDGSNAESISQTLLRPGLGEQPAPAGPGGGAATKTSGAPTVKEPEAAAGRRPTVHSTLDVYFPLRSRRRVRHPKALRLGLKWACAREEERLGDPVKPTPETSHAVGATLAASSAPSNTEMN